MLGDPSAADISSSAYHYHYYYCQNMQLCGAYEQTLLCSLVAGGCIEDVNDGIIEQRYPLHFELLMQHLYVSKSFAYNLLGNI